MRSFTAFLLLLALFVLAGCGGSSRTSGDPADVVTAWSQAINADPAPRPEVRWHRSERSGGIQGRRRQDRAVAPVADGGGRRAGRVGSRSHAAGGGDTGVAPTPTSRPPVGARRSLDRPAAFARDGNPVVRRGEASPVERRCAPGRATPTVAGRATLHLAEARFRIAPTPPSRPPAGPITTRVRRGEAKPRPTSDDRA